MSAEARTGTAACPECSEDMDVEYVDCGVAWVWHGVHCGWGHQVSSKDVRGAEGLPPAPERVYV